VPSPSANVDFAIAKTKTTKRAPRALLEHFHAEEGLEGNDDDDDDDDDVILSHQSPSFVLLTLSTH
jgi:hypothetical protein